MKIKFDYEKNGDFLEGLKFLKDMVTEVKLKAKKDILLIEVMDPANICIIIFKYKTSAFEEYVMDKEDEEIAFNISGLSAKIKDIKKGSVELSTDEAMLYIKNRTEKKSSEHSIPMLTDVEIKKHEPDLKYEGCISVDSGEFQEAIKEVNNENSIKFQVSNNILTLSTLEYTKNISKVEIGCEGDEIPGESRFSGMYMNKLATTKLSKRVSLEFKEEYPLTLRYVTENLVMKAIIAPTVDNT